MRDIQRFANVWPRTSWVAILVWSISDDVDEFIVESPGQFPSIETFKFDGCARHSEKSSMYCIWASTDEAVKKRTRLVVCLDSIYKVSDIAYDIILLDEDVLSRFRELLENAAKVIVMQHRLTESTINFYSTIMGLDPDDPSHITKRKFKKPTVLQPIKADFTMMLLYIMREVAAQEFGQEAMKRVKEVWAQVQKDP
ncbi:uncharacterized protein BYT42DRAFT_366724 [Radiomyces spectabilis]|uniref:uncharacterized protein n=1 Tax=Radiomyces spectabilis TaxID=64574 RepID=UPI0022208C81|nr:uncharacterized protein BYT42DRAFT_366724 [Radiomyces spectabilis]KAI8378080.1 hypothetical protein BYT42DRAFT_366724 [Radiomyces spectabilis]